MKLEKDLYAYLWLDPYENNCNTYLICGEVKVLIDPGHSRHVPNLFRQMEGDGISPEKIKEAGDREGPEQRPPGSHHAQALHRQWLRLYL